VNRLIRPGTSTVALRLCVSLAVTTASLGSSSLLA